jgi:SMI1-KNR4 cell-wall
MTIQITSEIPPVSLLEISNFERINELKFPDQYRDFLAKFNIGLPEANIIESVDLTTSVSVFYGICKNHPRDLLANKNMFEGRLPKNVITIAEAGGGDQICLQLETGAIFFWNHEEECGEDELPSYDNMSLLSPSFEGFLNNIKPYKSEDADLGSMEILSVELKPGFAEKFKDNIKK